MKKIVYGAIVALYGLFVAPDVEAQAGMTGSAKEIVAQNKLYPIEITNMPQMLCDAVNISYEGCMVKSAEVSDNSTLVKHRVVLFSRNGRVYRAYFDDRGHVVKKHAHFK